MSNATGQPTIVALAGGVGGAKLSLGLYHELPADTLSLIVNTADDLDVLGLHVSPDLDTAMYTLTGLVNPQTGWGVKDDTFDGLQMLGRYGYPTWFNLGDRDLATHLMRTSLLQQGLSLTDVCARLSSALGLRARLLPMCNEPVETVVSTATEQLPFQDYFVRRRAADPVTAITLRGIESAGLTDQAVAALQAAERVILCPSNPIVSIGPILAVPGIRDLLSGLDVPRIAVSPIVGHDAVSGPAGRMMRGLGYESTALGVARLYAGMVTALVIDESDSALAPSIERETGMKVIVAPTLMQTLDDKRSLARIVLATTR